MQDDIGEIKAEIEELARINKETTKGQEDTLAAMDEELETETAELEATVNKWTETDHNMESFGRLLDEAFNIAGCSNDHIIGILGI